MSIGRYRAERVLARFTPDDWLDPERRTAVIAAFNKEGIMAVPVGLDQVDFCDGAGPVTLLKWRTAATERETFEGGWSKLVGALEEVRALYNATTPNPIVIHQIKEKFGGLRYYTGAAPEWFLTLIDAVEEMSLRTCEECGEQGRTRGKGWVKTLCAPCAIRLDYPLTDIEQALIEAKRDPASAPLYKSVADVKADIERSKRGS